MLNTMGSNEIGSTSKVCLTWIQLNVQKQRAYLILSTLNRRENGEMPASNGSNDIQLVTKCDFLKVQLGFS